MCSLCAIHVLFVSRSDRKVKELKDKFLRMKGTPSLVSWACHMWGGVEGGLITSHMGGGYGAHHTWGWFDNVTHGGWFDNVTHVGWFDNCAIYL